MGIVSGLLTGRKTERRTLSLSELDAAMDRAVDGMPSATGLMIAPGTAMASSAVYSCVNVLSQDIASLPLITYRRLPRGKERAPEHRLYSILHDAPNPEMTSYEFRACMVGQMLLWGNSFAEIELSDAGINGLWPLRADRMEIQRNEQGDLVYKYTLPQPDPVTGLPYKMFPFRQIMHWRDLSGNGIMGISPIQANAETVGVDLATRQYGAKFFGNDSRPGGILTHPGKLTEQGANRMKASWESAFRGLTNAQRVAVLEEGVTWTAVGLPPEQAQFLETRKLTRSEIAGIYRVPPHKIGDLERATFSNVEEQDTDYLRSGLRPRLVQIEQALSRDLFKIGDGKRTHYAEHLQDAFLRGDTASRWAAYNQGLMTGVYSINDVREMENLNPVTNGDVHFVPVNMQTLENALKPPEPPAPPEPAGSQDGDDEGEGDGPAEAGATDGGGGDEEQE